MKNKNLLAFSALLLVALMGFLYSCQKKSASVGEQGATIAREVSSGALQDKACGKVTTAKLKFIEGGPGKWNSSTDYPDYGTLEIGNDETTLYVRYTVYTSAAVELQQLHLFVGNSSDIINFAGNPANGHFDYDFIVNSNTQGSIDITDDGYSVYTFAIPISELRDKGKLAEGDCLSILANAKVKGSSISGKGDVWAVGEASDGQVPAYVIGYCLQSCSEGGSVC